MLPIAFQSDNNEFTLSQAVYESFYPSLYNYDFKNVAKLIGKWNSMVLMGFFFIIREI